MADDQTPDMSMDANELYREETFTDRKVGTIRCLTPVTAEGADDSARTVLYMGQTQMLTPMGALPLNFEIPAANLAEAVDRFAGEAEKAAERTIEELKELRREAASQIVVPEMGGGGLGGQGGMGGGKIQMP